MKSVNETGIKEIHAFLAANHKLGGDHFDAEMLHAWARDAEFQLGEGNPACIEIKASDSINGRTQEYTISATGLDDDGKVVVGDECVGFDAAVNLMDNEIRETLHSSKEWESNQQFINAYIAAHAAKFDGEEFQVA